GGAIAGAFRDTFHPEPVTAAGWLAVLLFAPGYLFSGVDTITTKSGNREHPAEDLAARLVRYFLLVSGTVPNVQEWLYNPTDTRCDNPYMCKIDPRFPLTNPRHTARIKAMVERGVWAPPEVHTRAQAQTAMALLRKLLRPSGVIGWSQVQQNLTYLRNAVKVV